MKYLFNAWGEVEPSLIKKPVIIFFDYDGTLTPIADRPELAELSQAEKNILAQASTVSGLQMVIVSGRSLIDVKEKVCLPGIFYAGNHGLEFENSENFYIYPEALSWQKRIEELSEVLTIVLRPFSGVWVENKVFSLSIHYRLADPQKMDQIQGALLQTLNTRFDFLKLAVTEGKQIREIRPPVSWKEGAVFRWLLDLASEQIFGNPFLVYVGDDQSDEDAFRAVRKNGIGIKITHQPEEKSQAGYFLNSSAELFKFLEILTGVKRVRGPYPVLDWEPSKAASF